MRGGVRRAGPSLGCLVPLSFRSVRVGVAAGLSLSWHHGSALSGLWDDPCGLRDSARSVRGGVSSQSGGDDFTAAGRCGTGGGTARLVAGPDAAVAARWAWSVGDLLAAGRILDIAQHPVLAPDNAGTTMRGEDDFLGWVMGGSMLS